MAGENTGRREQGKNALYTEFESPIPSLSICSPIMSLQLSPAVLVAILEAVDSPVPMVLLHR